MDSPYKAGYEKGVQGLLPSHRYQVRSSADREFMKGFDAGKRHRAWLDSRGERRTRTKIFRVEPGYWRWEYLIENTIHSKGSARSEKAASVAAEHAAMDAIEAGFVYLKSLSQGDGHVA